MATACELIKHIKNIRTGQGHFPDISCMKSILMYVLWESRYVISNILEQEKPWNWRSLKYLPRPNANFVLIFGLGLTRARKNWLDSAVLVQEMNFYNVTSYNIYSTYVHSLKSHMYFWMGYLEVANAFCPMFPVDCIWECFKALYIFSPMCRGCNKCHNVC